MFATPTQVKCHQTTRHCHGDFKSTNPFNQTSIKRHQTLKKAEASIQDSLFKRSDIMGYFNIVATALLLACVHVEGIPSDCGLTYQRLLQDLVTLKGSCDGAGFRDCCQVRKNTSVVNTLLEMKS